MKKFLALFALFSLVSANTFAQSGPSLGHYQDMDCQQFIYAETTDDFTNFARNEITSMIEADYCELRSLASEEKDFMGAEYERAGVGEAAHSRLIEALYIEFFNL